MTKIPMTEGQSLSNGVRTLVGAMPFIEIAKKEHVAWRNAITKEGYQRKPGETRIKRFASELRSKNVDIPTAILINAEHISWMKALKQKSDGLFLFDTDNYLGTFNIVDGQHRLQALQKVYETNPSKIENLKLHVVMMLGANEDQELEQFYIVNSTAKSVKTDLALDLLKQRAVQNTSIMQELIGSGQRWKVEGQALVEQLNEHSEVWKDTIKLANQKGIGKTIPSSSFVTSLKNYLNSPLARSFDEKQNYDLLEAYWKGIKKAAPEAFSDPTVYNLQKGIGVWVMNALLPVVLEIIRSQNKSFFDSDAYKNILHDPLSKLSGEDANTESVVGTDFWRVASKGGVSGSYSSAAGKRVLVSKLENLLPFNSVR